jgi:hypothetical protein
MQIFIVMVSIPTLKYIIQLNNQQRVTTNYCARQGIANLCVITPFFPIYIYVYIGMRSWFVLYYAVFLRQTINN